jgi:hypothetical protein
LSQFFKNGFRFRERLAVELPDLGDHPAFELVLPEQKEAVAVKRPDKRIVGVAGVQNAVQGVFKRYTVFRIIYLRPDKQNAFPAADSIDDKVPIG